MFIVLWHCLMVQQVFLSPQVNQSVIISYKLIGYGTSDLALQDIEKLGNIKKIPKPYGIITYYLALLSKFFFSVLGRTSSKIGIELFP